MLRELSRIRRDNIAINALANIFANLYANYRELRYSY